MDCVRNGELILSLSSVTVIVTVASNVESVNTINQVNSVALAGIWKNYLLLSIDCGRHGYNFKKPRILKLSSSCCDLMPWQCLIRMIKLIHAVFQNINEYV